MFSYTVDPGRNAADLAVTGLALAGSMIQDAAGHNLAALPAGGINPDGVLVVDTTPTTLAISSDKSRARGITPRIARRGIEKSDRLGRHRWVVERSHAWFNRARRLPVRYERRADIDEAFTLLQASLITIHQIERFC